MNYIKKEKNLNLNDWIIYDKGLDYGLNLAKETYYFNNKIPDWYKVMEWDILNIELILNESNSGVRMTRILWCSDKIQSLLEKIKEFEELDKTNKRINNARINLKEYVLDFFTGINIPFRHLVLAHCFFPFRLQSLSFSNRFHNRKGCFGFQTGVDQIDHNIISCTDCSRNRCNPLLN